MEKKGPLYGEFGKLAGDVVAAAKAAGDEAKAVFRSGTERFMTDMDFVSREDHEALKELTQKALARIEELETEIEALKNPQ